MYKLTIIGRACNGPCNWSYCKAGIWGWCEYEILPWRPHLAQDQFCTTRGVRVGHGCGVVVKKDPCQTEFQFCRVPRMGGIKLQLLCGVRIELAVGSLPYPGKYGFPIASTGRDRLIWIPNCKTWGKIPLGIPTFLSMEGVHPPKPNQKSDVWCPFVKS